MLLACFQNIHCVCLFVDYCYTVNYYFISNDNRLLWFSRGPVFDALSGQFEKYKSIYQRWGGLGYSGTLPGLVNFCMLTI